MTASPPTTRLGRRRRDARADAAPAYESRRAEIIATAATVFLAKGYRATSFKDIAEAVGVDRASLYYYFESKQDLFRVATSSAVARNVEAAEQVAASRGAPAEKITQLMRDLFESYLHTDYPYMFIFLQEDVNRIADDPDDPWAHEMNELSRRYDRAVTSVIEEGVARGDFRIAGPARVLTKAMIGMANWTQRWYQHDGELGADELADAFAHTFLRGVLR
jgi:AcrR family transcriptional regulator